ncbi:hypothetical protein F5878DRAFT_645461 [Lentinula raphanica]|uniref:Uncharacterized protein n=1 Tax=Lentinula raphanica TaxID=153919 RepID=A0AA38P0S7_9AGAR|nr:hypothetical protein F5878DRAFT_645461 [Lentinula raphanica]
MPVSRRQTAPAELIKMRTRMIVDRLMFLRASRSMSMNPPCPRFDPKTEKVARKDLFHGASDNVNGPLHPGFWKLGKLFFVVTKLKPAPEDKAQIVFEEASIPAAVLLADSDLLRHLDRRATLKNISRRKVTRGISSSGSSSLPSSPTTPRSSATSSPSTPRSSATSSCSTPVNPSTPLPLPVTPGMSTVLVPSTPSAVAPARSNAIADSSKRSVNPGRAQSPNDEVEFVSTVLVPSTPGAVAPARSNVVVNPGRAQSPDDEVEFIGFLHPNGTVQPERPAKARASVGGSSRINQRSARVAPIITINIIVWFPDTHNLEAVRLPLASGQYMKLSMVSKVLQKLELDIHEDLDRYTPDKGWNPILLDTLFKVQDGDVLNLKYSAVHDIRNFDIHITHLY